MRVRVWDLNLGFRATGGLTVRALCPGVGDLCNSSGCGVWEVSCVVISLSLSPSLSPSVT